MKKIFFLMVALVLLVSACGTSAKQAAPSASVISSSPVAAVDLNATAAVMVQQTVQAMPTQTTIPSATPMVVTETATATPTLTVSPTLPVTLTETPNPVLLTLTATLGTGTPATIIPFSVDVTSDGAATGTEYPRTYGTMPPALPSGKIYLINKSNTDATVSLHCTTSDGYTTIIEYPVQGTIKAYAPAGKCHFISWVGGKRYTGDFRLEIGRTVSLIFYKDHVEIKASKD